MARKKLFQLLLSVAVVAVLFSTTAQAGDDAPAPGDLVVARMSGGGAVLEWYQPDGSLNRQLKVPEVQRAGAMTSHPDGSLFVTDSSDGQVVKYDRSGKRKGTFDGFVKPSSVVLDNNGNVYVGQQDKIDVVKLDSNGRRTPIDLAVVKGGETGQIDLASDQCTIYYRSARNIRRYDASRDRQRDDFAELGKGNENNGSLRSMPSGEVLVADQTRIIRLNPSGKVVKDYDVDGEDKWHHLALDPTGSGNSFWAAGGDTGKVYRFNLASGDVDRSLALTKVSGLAVQRTSAPRPAPQPVPPPAKKAPPVEDTPEAEKSDNAPSTATIPFKAPSATAPAGAPGAGAPAPTTNVAPAPSAPPGATNVAPAPSAPPEAGLGRAQAVRGPLLLGVGRDDANPDQALPQDASGTSDSDADSGGLAIGQLDFLSPEPRAGPQLPPGPVVAPEASSAEGPKAPLDQDQVTRRLRLGMSEERTYEGFLANGRGSGEGAWPFVVGSAAVMLFGAGLASRRRAERVGDPRLPARVRFHPRRY